MSVRNLIFILGDQLSDTLASLKSGDREQDVVFMCEVHDETTYVRHHKKKIAFILSAMRHHRDRLRVSGWTVDYVALMDENNSGSFTRELGRAIKRHQPERVLIVEPGEWRVRNNLDHWASDTDTKVTWLNDDRFVASLEEFRDWADGRKSLQMEYFYREMRKKTGLLMDGDQPEGGKWNYDQENRKPASDDLFIPKRCKFEPDETTSDVLSLVKSRFDNHFGALEPFWFAVTPLDAERALDHFMQDCLPDFGDYQDAMLEQHKFLYHGLVSFYINAGLLDPLETCKKVEAAYRNGKAPLNAVEGFIRQIIGWREFVRGIYWLNNAGYVHKNALNAQRALPAFYWTADTKMNCIKHVVEQTRDEAYAHHIQRLMVTGTFALIAGLDPHEVHEWYLAVYADAYEWVEAPNVIGMALFADGGQLGSKPYAASGSYINKMSDYCGSCHYNVNKKTEANSCPFNSLYWDFMIRNRETLAGNPRISRAYSTWDRMSEEKKDAYLERAKYVLDHIEEI